LYKSNTCLVDPLDPRPSVHSSRPRKPWRGSGSPTARACRPSIRAFAQPTVCGCLRAGRRQRGHLSVACLPFRADACGVVGPLIGQGPEACLALRGGRQQVSSKLEGHGPAGPTCSLHRLRARVGEGALLFGRRQRNIGKGTLESEPGSDRRGPGEGPPR
jgi:hypothetical protein